MHNRVDVEKLKKFLTGRIDIKNHGNQTNSIEIVECSDENINLEYPNWFSDDKGQGIVLQSFSCEINLKIKCIGDGLLNIDLRGIDIRDNKNNKIQLPIEFNNFFVNNKKVMTSVICTHENKFTYRKDVKDSEKVEVIVKWYPINYLSNYI